MNVVPDKVVPIEMEALLHVARPPIIMGCVTRAAFILIMQPRYHTALSKSFCILIILTLSLAKWAVSKVYYRRYLLFGLPLRFGPQQLILIFNLVTDIFCTFAFSHTLKSRQVSSKRLKMQLQNPKALTA